MFQPETEDMLPRTAPKPSVGIPLAHNEASIKPTVPEVSIIFGQENGSVAPQQPQNMKSYASWKKQALPRVTYPSTLVPEMDCVTTKNTNINNVPNEYSAPLPRSNVYPLRTMNCAEYLPELSNRNIALNSNMESAQQFQRNIESRYTLPQSIPMQRRSMDTVLPYTNQKCANNQEVLTICASTQTESVCISSTINSSTDLSSLATKKDLDAIYNVLNNIRDEQIRLMQLCESMLLERQPSCTTKDVGSQCELLASNNAAAVANVKRQMPIIHDIIEEPDEEPNYVPPTYNQQKTPLNYQSPQAVRPTAQSTGYHPNTPQGKHCQQMPNMGTALTKPNTEKSMVMNELAFKYLPQEKLNDLLQELRMSPTCEQKSAAPTIPIPLRQIDNFDKSPNDISNASYKYLKKYRLLPEEQQGTNRHHQSSPQRQRANSPLIMTNGSPVTRNQANNLDLEHLRNQPKYL